DVLENGDGRFYVAEADRPAKQAGRFAPAFAGSGDSRIADVQVIVLPELMMPRIGRSVQPRIAELRELAHGPILTGADLGNAHKLGGGGDFRFALFSAAACASRGPTTGPTRTAAPGCWGQEVIDDEVREGSPAARDQVVPRSGSVRTGRSARNVVEVAG